MNDKSDLKYTVVCLCIYGGGITLGAAFWYGVYVVLHAVGIVPWRAVVETALLALAAVAVACRLVER